MKYKKEITFSAITLVVFGLLVFLEVTLPNFARFLPVRENKFLVVVLNINLLLILFLFFLITRIFLKSYIEKKRGIWGSSLKKRLTSTLLFISIVPSFTLFILATGFFYVNMDRWFGQKIEDTLENALTLSQYHYEDIFDRYGKIATLLTSEITKRGLLDNERALKNFMAKNEKIYFLEYFSVYDLTTKAIIKSNPVDGIEKQLLAKVKTVMRDQEVREIIPVSDGEMIIMGRQILDEDGTPEAVLFIGDAMKVQGTERIKEIAAASKEFKESRVIKKVLKYSFIVPLFLITMLTIFLSIWVGIKMAAEITVPIEKMKEGAAIIARGKFDINLEDRGKDEISTLVKAFNSMASELQIAKNEIEERRRYMEVILDNVATGIISTDKTGHIVLLNRAAKHILGAEKESWHGISLREVFGSDFRMLTKSFLREVKTTGETSTTKELRLNIKKDITYIRASLTALKDESNKIEGFIVAFDDITHIVRAEKLATWREVARKLTHEIKNPLTPILLSAERIRRKIVPHSEGEDKEALDEATSVIIRSVDDIKGIVNELTKLTHISQAKTLEDLNAIVEETVDLYKNLYQNIAFHVERQPIPHFRMDRDGLKRALINLITNSVKALNGDQGAIGIRTRYEKERSTAIIEFTDTGKGIAPEDKERIFDPYFTKDEGGTGLGLAIVHAIILEHQGKINVEDNVPRGTKFIIELPVMEA
ncbi:MAG TPA: ATP-binding protein [Syntrophorhabdaceae bacterium]|nr:ATP-binding protein [Syntrophorhabdaceae bacterium]